MANSLDENIKALRLAKGLNQPELARLLGVTKQCVSNWENGNILPSLDMLVRLSDIFNVTTDYLLGREKRRMLDVSHLSDREIGHLSLIIDDLSKKENE